MKEIILSNLIKKLIISSIAFDSYGEYEISSSNLDNVTDMGDWKIKIQCTRMPKDGFKAIETAKIKRKQK